ncbi:hypothetical protein C481_05625 [Natrialba asiatica DSM 12278]|uniref:Uncharacterized protein n=2 Tax=Natrialba asiatica TaxID=64602 RepID=M0AZQ2_NATA1|nr:hypothetical protein C481_05625 [Natrialba asiatica DSM 12278]
MTVALTGTAAADDTSAETSQSESFDDLYAFLPATLAEQESLSVSAIDYDRMRQANDPATIMPAGGPFDLDADAVSKSVRVFSRDQSFSQPLQVFTGDIELEGTADTRETAGIEYDYYTQSDRDVVAGVTDDALVLSTTRGTIEQALAAAAGETDRLLDAAPAIDDGFEAVSEADTKAVMTGTRQSLSVDLDGDIRYVSHAQTVQGPDTLTVTQVIEFTDESDITDELLETIEADLAYVSTAEEPSAEVDGSVVTITVDRDLAAERAVREHESPGSLRAERDIDLDAEYLEIELRRGDPTPVEDLTLELDDEEYDRDIWADGHGTLEAGDTIRIKMDDVEPNLSLRLRHDHELGNSSSGTSILSHFQFTSTYDIDSGTLSIEYADEYPLDGDNVFLAAYDERPYYRPDESAPEPKTTAQPWEGKTLASGDEATLEDIAPGDTILVCWKGTDYEDSISRAQAEPPGIARFEYDYESKTVSASLEFGDTRPQPRIAEVSEAETEPSTDEIERDATEYELRIDDEPAGTQWSDEFDTVSSGATIEIADIPVGSDVTVVWAATGTRIGGTRTQPQVDLEYDDGTITHVGGDALSATDLTLRLSTETDRFTIELEDVISGTFEEGDSFEITAETVGSDDEIGAVRYAHLLYGKQDQYHVGYVSLDR